MIIEEPEYKYSDLTHKIIGCAMNIHSFLGNGFQELIYQRALVYKFQKANINFQREIEIDIYYRDMPKPVGTRRADFIAENKVLIELKAVSHLDESHWAQTLNYLRAYRLEVGLLINFGEKSLVFKRFALTPNPKLFQS
jgi:GxxExxY protein